MRPLSPLGLVDIVQAHPLVAVAVFVLAVIVQMQTRVLG